MWAGYTKDTKDSTSLITATGDQARQGHVDKTVAVYSRHAVPVTVVCAESPVTPDWSRVVRRQSHFADSAQNNSLQKLPHSDNSLCHNVCVKYNIEWAREKKLKHNVVRITHTSSFYLSSFSLMCSVTGLNFSLRFKFFHADTLYYITPAINVLSLKTV